MTPVEELLDRTTRRHMREITIAANMPPVRLRNSASCPHCQAVLTVSEITERWCGTCRQEHQVQP